MRFQRARRSTSMAARLDDAVLPLTNVVFLLLIFFMLAGQLATPSPLGVKPPHSTSPTPVDQRGIEVSLAADGRVALDDQPIQDDALEKAVRQRLQRRPNTPIRLRADAGLATSRVVKMMHVLRAAGAHRLRLVTQSTRG
ncbi:ExbD/TolR family protein [Salinisphaera sp. RV14]|uniref:ExbD/TolR family protein n=1 Tax=Salinisphaera sp. RV14 TaxID=3454140 RepID=UPI003F858A56